VLRSHLDHVSWWPALDQELLVRPNPAAPPGLEGRSGPARPLHPLASTRHPLVMRCSHGAGSLQALESFWSGSHSRAPPRFRVSVLSEETRPCPCSACLQAPSSSRGPLRRGLAPPVRRLLYFGTRNLKNREARGRALETHFPANSAGTSRFGAMRAGEIRTDSMNPPYSELPSPPSSRRLDRVLQRPAGDSRGDDVSPVSSDATGVRENGGERGREDATRPRHRYIIH
jgi:hypothetical protein